MAKTICKHLINSSIFLIPFILCLNLNPVCAQEIIYLPGVDSVKLKATVLKFSTAVYKSEYLPETQNIAFTLRQFDPLAKIYIAYRSLNCYNMDSKSIDWDYYITGGNNFFNDSIAILQSGEVSKFIDIRTGKQLFEIKGVTLWIDNKIKYKNQRGIGVTTQGNFITLKDGFPFANVGKDLEAGIRDMDIVNDSLIIVAGNGLSGINLHSGEKWTMAGNSTQNNPAMKALGISMVVLSFAEVFVSKGAVVTPAINSITPQNNWTHDNNYSMDRYYNIASNIFIDSNEIYYASAESLINTDLNGNLHWKKDLLAKESGMSELFMHNNDLVFLEFGGAAVANGYKPHGKINCRILDKNSGLVLHDFELNKFAGSVVNLYVDGDFLHLITFNRYLQIDLKNKTINIRTELPESLVSAGDKLINQVNYFFKPQGGTTYIPIKDENNKSIFMIKTSGQIIEFHPDGSWTKSLTPDQLFLRVYESADKWIMSNGLYSEICEPGGRVLIHIPYEGNWSDVGPYLILQSKKKAIIFEKQDIDLLK